MTPTMPSGCGMTLRCTALLDVQHFAVPPGHEVCATAEVVNVEGKRVDFKVSASDGIEEAAEPTNELSSIFVRSTSALPKRGLLTQRPT